MTQTSQQSNEVNTTIIWYVKDEEMKAQRSHTGGEKTETTGSATKDISKRGERVVRMLWMERQREVADGRSCPASCVPGGKPLHVLKWGGDWLLVYS